jgi:holliday junction DNA helicase RuvA
MIASLQGTVQAVGKDFLVINVGGVGFRIFVPQVLLDALGRGQEISLFTHLHVRENELALYGCASEEELALFHLLQTVSALDLEPHWPCCPPCRPTGCASRWPRRISRS